MEYRIRDFMHPIRIWKFSRFLNKSQWLDKNTLKEYQDECMRKLVKHSFDNVPYYHHLFNRLGLKPDDIKKQEDLPKLPVVTKKIIMENFDCFIAKNLLPKSPSVGITSGSTGTPLRLYYDASSNIAEFCTVLRFSKWCGYTLGERICDIRGHVFKNGANWRMDWKMNRLQLSSFDMKKENIDLYVSKLQKFKPKVLRGYPSSLYILATWLKEKNLKIPKPTCIITASETLLDFQKSLIEEVFEARVFDYYGSTERAVFVCHCEKQNYHINQEYGILEVVGDKNISLESNGQTGEIIGTSLHNYLFPLIRYKMDDLAVTQDIECSCGRNFPTIKEIIGRIEDIVITPDGRHVGRLDRAFAPVEGIIKSQIIQDNVEEINVNIVKTSKFDDKQKEVLLRELRYRLGEKIKININMQGDIPTTKSGKLKFVISNLNNPGQVMAAYQLKQ